MMKIRASLLTGLLLPQLARASDYSGLVPLYITFVVLIGGFLAGFEWMIINAFTDRGQTAGDEDPEAQDQARFGCGLALLLWFLNSVIAHFVIITIWG